MLFLSRSTISGNTAGEGNSADAGGGNGGSGGGLYNVSSVTAVDCTINNNQSSRGGFGGGVGCCNNEARPGGNGGNGGGIYSAGTIYLTNTTIYGNSAGAGGGGGSDLSMFPRQSGNGGNGGDGGGLYFAGTGTLVSCTFSKGITGAAGPTGQGSVPGNNGAPGRGGGIWNQSGTLQVLNTVIASNAAYGDAPDAGGTFASQGHNLIGVTNGSQGFGVSGDLLNVAALLGPLAANGGPTFTCTLLPGSPALDAGDDSLTGTDQRGQPRLSGAHVDIGAFETQMPSAPPQLGVTSLSGGGLRLSFTNTPGATFTVLASTNVALPSTNWSAIGPVVENAPGQFQYTAPATTNAELRFYQIRWP